MASPFQVNFDVRDMLKGLDAVSAKVIPGAVRRAMTRTMASAKVAMSRAVAEDMGLKVSRVKDEISVSVVETATSSTDFVGQLSVSGRQIPLIEFSGKGPLPSRGRGRVTARMQGTRKTYRGAFVAEMSSGHKGIFKRVGAARKSRGAWSKNLPIVELKGPSLPHVFAKKADVGIARAQEQMVKELQHEIEYALQKAAS